TPKRLREPAPDAGALALAARAAMRAPDNGPTTPFRFVAVPQDKRGDLADLFEAAARRRGDDGEGAAKARSKAMKGPMLIGFVVRNDGAAGSFEAMEQSVTAGAALEQFLLALHALGYGAVVYSGGLLADAGVQGAFCERAGERLLAWITAGTPAEDAAFPPEEREGPLSRWQGL
ncbi:MAG: nitroreductase family protein, partial [Duodenibacillus sp.]|nr:nitroreductase family protein [Duodenibacillus sp.]